MSISFASVCIRKLERLQMLLSQQRSAFNADISVEETYSSFLETVLYTLKAANTVRDTSVRFPGFSSNRMSQILAQRVTTNFYGIGKRPAISQGKEDRGERRLQSVITGTILKNSNKLSDRNYPPTSHRHSTGRLNLANQLYGTVTEALNRG